MNIPASRPIFGHRLNADIFGDMQDRAAQEARRARQHSALRTFATAVGGAALMLGILLAAWVQADGPAKLIHDYHRACEMGADCQ